MAGLDHLRIRGLMTMPPYFDDPGRARPYFRQLRENPKKELFQLYCGNQLNSTTYGMLSAVRELTSELREEYRQAWLDEATPFRLQSALYRWDAEWDYWTAVQRLLVQEVFQGWKEGEPFPPLESIRPKVK